MIKDIYNTSNEVMIDEKTYKLEFDNKAYATVENLLDKGTFGIFQKFVLDIDFCLSEIVKIFCAGLIKHHTEEEIGEIRSKLDENPAILHRYLNVLQFAFANPLLLPESAKKKSSAAENGGKKKDSEEEIDYDWVSMYASARNILGWSDEEFFAATPRKYYAHYYAYCNLYHELKTPAKQEPLIGKDAINALVRVAGGIR